MTDVIERLRAANPVPDCPPPPIQDVWRRVELDERAPLARGLSGRGLSARRPNLGGVMSAIAAVTALAVAVAAISLLGHRHVGSSATSPQSRGKSKTSVGQTSSVRALLDELGILRESQTAQARAFNTSQRERSKPGQPLTPPERLLPSLTRLVKLPAGGKLFLYVARTSPTGSPAYGLGYHEAYPGIDSDGCCETASALRAPPNPGPNQVASNPEQHRTYFEIVPDGVARVRWGFPRNPIGLVSRASDHPRLFPSALTVSAVVHDNVAALRLPSRGLAASDTWYAADGHVIATYAVNYSIVKDCTSNGRLTRPYTAGQLRRALATMPATIKSYTGCWNVIQQALRLKTGAKPSPNHGSSAR